MQELTRFLSNYLKNSKKANLLEQGKALFDLNLERRRFLDQLYLMYCTRFGSILISKSYGLNYRDLLHRFSTKDKPVTLWLKLLREFIETYLSDDDLQIKVFKSLLSPGYDPPDNLSAMIIHLYSLKMYYSFFVHRMPFEVTLRMDLASAKIAGAASRMIGLFDEKGRQISTYLEGIKTIQSNMRKKTQYALDIFYQMDTRGMSFQNIAKTIQERLIERGIYPNLEHRGKKPDRTKSIKRYLLADENVRKDLKKLGIRKDKRKV
jgi:hypothetical protein